MDLISKLSKSTSLRYVTIEYEGEEFKIDLFSDLLISEQRLSKQLKTQPSIYAFLTSLNAGLIKKVAEFERDKDKAYSQAYLKSKDKINSKTQRPNSDDVAKALAEIDVNYNIKNKKFLNARREQSVVGSLVKAFEQRASILQTLSANKRSENF